MIGYLIVGVAVLGTGYAAYLDLRTTEVPDSVSYMTAGAALALHFVVSYSHGDFSYLVTALGVGSVFFVVGGLFYLLGVWGGADAFVMGATGFALPYLPEVFVPLIEAPWPFPLTLGMNVFVIGTVYVLGFAFYQGLRQKSVMKQFWREMRDDWRRVTVIAIVYLAVMGGALVTLGSGFSGEAGVVLFSYSLLLIGLLVLYRFLRIVEAEAMTYTVDVEELERGDVIQEAVKVEGEVQRHKSFIGVLVEHVRGINPVTLVDPVLRDIEETIGYPKIVGLTEKEIEKIQETRDSVTVKTGVRFVPAFPVAILVSVFVGDIVYLLMSTAFL